MLETLLQPNDTDERCGFVLKDGTIVEIDNVALEPARSYEMDPEQALPHVKAGTIAATWHTHPDADPGFSHEDNDGFLAWPDLKHHIIGMRDGEVAVLTYEIDDGLVVCV